MTRKKIICILLAALPLLPGCVKNILDSAAPGTQINFAASTSYDNNPGTKTEYSGVFTNETVSGVTHKYERINWVSGDKIRIYSPQAAQQGNAGVHDADYDIQASSISNSGRNSSARISSTSNTGGLVWGEGSSNYNFYALYPSPATTGIQTGVSMNGSTVTAPIPQYQRMVGTAPREVNDPTTTSGKRLVYDPDMNYAYMYAAAAATNGGTVDLRFRPLMTAFEITLGTKDPNGMEIREIYLSSNSSNHPSDPSLSGTFNATINAGNTFTLNNVTGGSSTIYADLPEFVAGNTVTVQYGRPITFTLFALPKDLTNMAIKIRLANGTTRDYEFRQTSVSGPFVVFPACRKVRITNLNAPQAETWTYTIDPIDPITLYG
ncbi:MAG: fimbrillin family protein, partial [Bacteroidales bacterium]|nr:fimbrillin family protein [Bacteroidales bacterium]